MSDTASISFIGVTSRKYMPGIRHCWSSLALSKMSRIGLRALSLEFGVWGCRASDLKAFGASGRRDGFLSNSLVRF